MYPEPDPKKALEEDNETTFLLEEIYDKIDHVIVPGDQMKTDLICKAIVQHMLEHKYTTAQSIENFLTHISLTGVTGGDFTV